MPAWFGRSRLRKDYSLTFYLFAIAFLLLAAGFVFVFGQTWSYWQALHYLKQHRKPGEPLLADAAVGWMTPKPRDVRIIRSSSYIPSSLWHGGRNVWVLEQRRTRLRKSLPSRSFCDDGKSFGWLKRFRLRRCRMLAGRSVPMRRFLRRAKIELGGKSCRWRRYACRFGRSWRRVERLFSFPSGGTNHTCVYAHPIRNKWLTIRFPVADVSGGVRFSFGFRDGYGGDVPLRVMLRMHNRGKGKVKTTDLLDESIPHKARWHVRFVEQQKVKGVEKAALEVRLWTTHDGAKPFCFELLALQAAGTPQPRKRRRR